MVNGMMQSEVAVRIEYGDRHRGLLQIEQATWSLKINGVFPHLVGSSVRISACDPETGKLAVGRALCTLATPPQQGDEGFTQFVGSGMLVWA